MSANSEAKTAWSLDWRTTLYGSVSKTAGVNQSLELELRPFGEEDRELPALRPHPEAVLAAERRSCAAAVLPEAISSRLIQPKLRPASAARRARHDAALPGGRDGHFGLALLIAQHDEVRVALQECSVVTKTGGASAVSERCGGAHNKNRGNNRIPFHEPETRR